MTFILPNRNIESWLWEVQINNCAQFAKQQLSKFKLRFVFLRVLKKLSGGMSELSTHNAHVPNFMKMNQEQNTGIKQDQQFLN